MTLKPDDLPAHLRYATNARGALHMPEIHTNAYGALHLSESTAEKGSFVWLRASAASSLDNPLTDRHEVVLHVSLEDLLTLVEQCEFLAHHHRDARRQSGEL